MTAVPDRFGRDGAHLADVAACALLAILAILAMATFRHYGLGWDDYTHAEYGELLLSYYASWFEDDRALSFVNLYYYGGGFDMVSALVARFLPLDLFAARRLVGAAVGLIGLAITWRLGRRLGGPYAGLAALVLLALCPNYYGHMFMNAKDMPFAVAHIGLIYALVRALQEYPRPSWTTVSYFGLALGLTLGTRIMGGISVIAVIFAAGFLFVLEARRLGAAPVAGQFATLAGRLGIGLMLGYAVMGVVWPWAIVSPLNPLRAVIYFTKFWEVPWRELFEGMPVLVPDMPRSYLPKLLVFKLPEFELFAFGLGLALAVWRAFRSDLPANRRAIEVLLIGAFVAPVLVTVLTRPAMYNGMRHFLFLLPLLAVVGGVAVAWLGERLAARRVAFAATFLVLAGGATLTAVDMARIHPYEYAHFNYIAGGLRAADREFMLDYWGLAFKQAAEELRADLERRHAKPPKGRRWKVATCGPHNAAKIALGPRFNVSAETQDADFFLILGEYYCKRLPGQPLVEIVREGVVFASVFERQAIPPDSIFIGPPAPVQVARPAPQTP